MSEEEIEILNVPRAEIRPQLYSHAQELKRIYRTGTKSPAQACKQFVSSLKTFVEREFAAQERINRQCRVFGFMVWNTERDTYEREMIYHIPPDTQYTQDWSQKIFTSVFVPGSSEQRMTLQYRDSKDLTRQQRLLAELGSDLIFSGPFDHRPTIVVDLTDDAAKHTRLESIPNIFEVDLGFTKDRELLADIGKFKTSHYDTKNPLDSTVFRSELTAVLSDHFYPRYFDEWINGFKDRDINRFEKRDSVSADVLGLIRKKNYDVQDLFYTKIINLFMFPDAKHMYFLPADIMQYEPSGGFFFVSTAKVKEDDILQWAFQALNLFSIIPSLNQQVERATFAHRHLGLISTLEQDLRRIEPQPQNMQRMSAAIVAIKAAFFPFRGGKYDDERFYYESLEDPIEIYSEIAAYLALYRLQRHDDYRNRASEYLNQDNGVRNFIETIRLELPTQESKRKHHWTIARENFGIMLIQMLDQAMYHAFRTKHESVIPINPTKVQLKEIIETETGTTQFLQVSVINPSSGNVPGDAPAKDQREFRQLGEYLALEDVAGPAPLHNDDQQWATSFKITYWRDRGRK